jgi:hypothetical protein
MSEGRYDGGAIFRTPATQKLMAKWLWNRLNAPQPWDPEYEPILRARLERLKQNLPFKAPSSSSPLPLPGNKPGHE